MGQTIGRMRSLGMTAAIEGREELTLIDPGSEAAILAALGAPGGDPALQVMEVEGLSRRLGKPIRRIVLTHYHIDHVANLGQYDAIAPARNDGGFTVIAHLNSPVFHEALVWAGREAEATHDGVRYRFLPLGGHSEVADDLAVFLPEQGVLFCGDLCQPQGERYEEARGPSPVPLFADGEAYKASLLRLHAVPFRRLQLGHGATLGEEAGRQAIRTTLQVILRIQALALKLGAEHPDESPETLCEWIFDTIAAERRFDLGQAAARKREPFCAGLTPYQLFDKPGISFFVQKALAEARGEVMPTPARGEWARGVLGPQAEACPIIAAHGEMLKGEVVHRLDLARRLARVALRAREADEDLGRAQAAFDPALRVMLGKARNREQGTVSLIKKVLKTEFGITLL